MEVSLPVDIAKLSSALDPYGVCLGIHENGSHAKQIDDQTIIAKRTASNVVTTASDGRQDVVLAREVDTSHHVGRASTSQDGTRILVYQCIPVATRFLVGWIIAHDQAAVQPFGKLRDRLFSYWLSATIKQIPDGHDVLLYT